MKPPRLVRGGGRGGSSLSGRRGEGAREIATLRAADRIDQLIQQADVSLLGGDELVLHQFAARGIDVVGSFLIVLQAVLLAFLQGLEAGGVAEQIGGTLRKLRPR